MNIMNLKALLKLGILLVLSGLVTFAISSGKRQDVSKSVRVVAKAGPLQGMTAYTDSYALFVGISDYQNSDIPKLPSAENDAKSVRDMLVTKFGFNPDPGHTVVLLGKDATQQNIIRQLSRLSDAKRVNKSDRVLVYFSCHGQRVPLPNGEAAGYLIPWEATIKLNDVSNPSEYQASCLDIEDVVKRLTASPARHRAVIVDACFSGFAVGSKGFADGKPLAPDLLKKLLDQRGVSIMTAGTSEDEALASNSRTGLSPFTRCLIDSLNKADVNGGTFTLGEMASEVKTRTRELTKGQQSPQFGVRDGVGELILFPTLLAAPILSDPGAVKKLSTSAVLQVTVTPETAKIEVDGRLVGSTSTFDVEPGGKKKVTVRISASGFETEAYEVELTAGKIVPLVVTLTALRTTPGPTSNSKTKLSTKGKVDMVLVPKGYFSMGSTTYDSEKPVRRVFLDAYWIGKNDVTVAQFRAYCDDSGYNYDWGGHKPDWGWKDDHPMVRVTWDEARAYCQWAGGDLPTEAQWEKAARGEEGRVYPWGETYDESKLQANAKSTAPVGSFPSGASPYGCLDMAGNVWQWCLDYYGDYDASATQNPTGAGTGKSRVLRGGSWDNLNPDYFRCALRNYADPPLGSSTSGFVLPDIFDPFPFFTFSL
jgi:formylglycine-generating enzyme required for sulfatase activity